MTLAAVECSRLCRDPAVMKATAQHALAALAEFDPDALIVDIALPGHSGWEIARAVRKIGPYGEQRPLLIAISGRYTKGSDQILGEISGFNYQLAKPFDPIELIALMKSVKPTSSSAAHSRERFAFSFGFRKRQGAVGFAADVTHQRNDHSLALLGQSLRELGERELRLLLDLTKLLQKLFLIHCF